MVRRAVKAVIYGTGLAVLLYGYFFVPLGDRTLFEHTRRIAATDEAQALSDDVEVASERLEGVVRTKLRDLEVGDAATSMSDRLSEAIDSDERAPSTEDEVD